MTEKDTQKTVTMTVEELRKLVAEEVENAKANAVYVRDKQMVKKAAPKEKVVHVTPVADPDKYTDVIMGSVNGVPFKVVCDEDNEVPESVARVLEYSRKEDARIKREMRRKNDEWQRATEKL